MKQLFYLVFCLASLAATAQNVGIGTTSPLAKLSVNGDFSLMSAPLTITDGINYALDVNSNKFSNYRLSGPTANFVIAGITAGSEGRLITLYNRSGHSLVFYNEDPTAFDADRIITATGSTLAIYNGGAAVMQYDASLSRWIVQTTHYSSLDYYGGSSTSYWNLNGSNIYNSNAGNVVIGDGTASTSESYKLNITRSDLGLGMYDASNNFYGSFANKNGNLWIGSTYSFLTIPAKHILLNPPNNTGPIFTGFPGNVGINTVDPSHAKLEINGSVGAAVAMFGADKHGLTISADNPEIGFNYFYNNGTHAIKPGYAAYMGMDRTNGNIYIGNFNGNQSSSPFGPISDPQFRIYILQNGNVGIGTTDPTYKLSVNGNIRSKEVVVESGWADYVFGEKYQLKPLSEVEKFIQENKHLPNIPSAAEIEKNGLALGEVQKKMMEKIEELTLYIIEQEKKLEELRIQINQSKITGYAK